MTTWNSALCQIPIHHLRTGGPKPPLLLLHGLAASGACWTPLARGLESEYDVVMPDARGHGQSGKPLRGYSYEDHAGDVIALIRGLRLSAPVLLGHSMGGLAAALVASRSAIKLRGLILVDPTFLSPQRQREVYDSDVAEQHRKLLRRDRREVLRDLQSRHSRRSPEILERIATARLQTCVEAFEVLAPPNPDYRELVGTIDVATLLVIGDAGVVSAEMAGELQNLNPRLRVEVIEEAGHGLPFDQPERLQAAVRAFMQSLPAQA